MPIWAPASSHSIRDIDHGEGVLKSTCEMDLDAGDGQQRLGQQRLRPAHDLEDCRRPDRPQYGVCTQVSAVAEWVAGQQKILKSTDGGLNWTDTTATISTTAAYTDLVIDPLTPGALCRCPGALFFF